MENSAKFFCNKSCKYFPCHEGVEEDRFNCMFCYCPLNRLDHCPGNPVFVESKGKVIKDCMGCNYPHIPENYDTIISILKKNIQDFGPEALKRNKK